MGHKIGGRIGRGLSGWFVLALEHPSAQFFARRLGEGEMIQTDRIGGGNHGSIEPAGNSGQKLMVHNVWKLA